MIDFRRLLAAPLLLLPATAQASFADLAAIDREVAAFTGAGPGAAGGAATPVDRRLRLTPCAAPLALSWRGVRHDAVLVQCLDNGGWHLFVPIRPSAAGSAAPPAIAVMRGEAVTVEVAGEGFAVSQSGEALEAGAVGAWIRVRLARDGTRAEPLRAQVVRPGLVALLLP